MQASGMQWIIRTLPLTWIVQENEFNIKYKIPTVALNNDTSREEAYLECMPYILCGLGERRDVFVQRLLDLIRFPSPASRFSNTSKVFVWIQLGDTLI